MESTSIKVKLNDSDDFQSPAVKTALTARLKSNMLKSKKKKSKGKQKLITEAFTPPKKIDVDPDDLQLALALSISARNQEETEKNMSNVMTTLERYGFQYNKSKLSVQNRRDKSEVRCLSI